MRRLLEGVVLGAGLTVVIVIGIGEGLARRVLSEYGENRGLRGPEVWNDEFGNTWEGR